MKNQKNANFFEKTQAKAKIFVKLIKIKKQRKKVKKRKKLIIFEKRKKPS